MALYDFPLEELQRYNPLIQEPDDFDDFWMKTLQDARNFPLNPEFRLIDIGLSTLDVWDVTFSGYGGHRIKAWFLLPHLPEHHGGLPCIVNFLGYGGGRGNPWDWLGFPAAGYASLVMDTRGQGSVWRKGDTPDSESESYPQVPGFMTRGILNPDTYYYRRVFTDGVRAVETVRTRPEVDSREIILSGASQGGGITLAVGALVPDLAAVMPDVPFLCHFRRSSEITDDAPYSEIVQYCKTHRHRIDTVFSTLNYFDGVHFASRATSSALFSVALMDTICPPSGVFAAYNNYGCEKKDIKVYRFNNHEGGESDQFGEKLAFLRKIIGR